MNLTQAFKMAIKSILTKKTRSFLTMLGIIIGIASVMIIVSVVSGSNKKMMEYYESMGTNKITIIAYSYYGNSKQIFEDIYDYCRGLGDRVVGVTPSSSVDGIIKYNEKTSETMDYTPQIYLGSDQYSLCNNFTIEKGRDLTYLDVQNYNPVCVLGARSASLFFDTMNPVGQEITISGARFTVIGVYTAKDPDSDWSLDNIVVLPYTASRYLGQDANFTEISVKAKDSASITPLIDLLNGYLSGLLPEGTGDSSVYSDNQWMQQSNQQNLMMSLILGGIAFISLLVGGIGIMNIMLVTVTERTREIGIRRAIGAERRSIVAQFLIEAATICGVGGIIGIAIGFAGTAIASKLMLQSVILPSPLITVSAFVFSVFLGILFGLFPAVKASKLQPVVALRAE